MSRNPVIKNKIFFIHFSLARISVLAPNSLTLYTLSGIPAHHYFLWPGPGRGTVVGKAYSRHPCTKTLLQIRFADARDKGITRRGNRCTKTTVFVHIFLDNKSVRAQGERMTNEKPVRVAL